jgi:TROVE domain-containing protein
MAKFNTVATQAKATRSPITTVTGLVATNAEGQPGYVRDTKSELVMLAIANMVGEKTFYEDAGKRDERFDSLVRQVAIEAPGWTLDFLTWLRTGAGMRTASIAAAIEVVAARRAHTGELPGAATPRQVVDAVCRRADEPGELLAGWIARYGKPIPIALKRGLSDAVVRLYTERNMLKYDGVDKPLRFGDGVDLLCPRYHKPAVRGTWQEQLFGHAIDRRHGRAAEIPARLPVLRANADLRRAATEDPSVLLDPQRLADAGMTWEDALSLGGSRLDKGKLWEAMIPSMRVGALVKNLRNFDQAEVSDELAEKVIAKISDPAEVAASRIMPLRLLAAYRHAPSMRWSPALEKALQATLVNVPVLRGRTLILLDVSYSMNDSVSGRSKLNRADTAGIFAAALAVRCEAPTLVWFNERTDRIDVARNESVLRILDRKVPRPDRGTLTAAATQKWYAGHDQVLIFTDEQQSGYGDPSDYVPKHVPLITWNVAGYKIAHTPSGTANRHTIGGLSDSMFALVPPLVAGLSAGWPWENKTA